MRHLLAAIAGFLAFASFASAATLTITPDKQSYRVGDMIALDIFGDSEGAESAYIGVNGRILFDTDLADYVDSHQEPLTTSGSRWALFQLAGGEGFADAFAQWHGEDVPVDGPLSARVRLLATAPGTLDYSWETKDPQYLLYFFGLFDRSRRQRQDRPRARHGGTRRARLARHADQSALRPLRVGRANPVGFAGLLKPNWFKSCSTLESGHVRFPEVLSRTQLIVRAAAQGDALRRVRLGSRPRLDVVIFDEVPRIRTDCRFPRHRCSGRHRAARLRAESRREYVLTASRPESWLLARASRPRSRQTSACGLVRARS